MTLKGYKTDYREDSNVHQPFIVCGPFFGYGQAPSPTLNYGDEPTKRQCSK